MRERGEREREREKRKEQRSLTREKNRLLQERKDNNEVSSNLTAVCNHSAK